MYASIFVKGHWKKNTRALKAEDGVEINFVNVNGKTVAAVRLELYNGMVRAIVWNDTKDDEPIFNENLISVEEAEAYEAKE